MGNTFVRKYSLQFIDDGGRPVGDAIDINPESMVKPGPEESAQEPYLCADVPEGATTFEVIQIEEE